MSEWYRDLPRGYKRIIETVCTPAELEAVKLRCEGLSDRRISHALGISRTTVRDRLNRAAAKIRAATGAHTRKDILLAPIDSASNRRRAKARNSAYERYDRGAIIARDSGICHLCGAVPTPADLTLDHLIPISLGGPDTAANVAVCCRFCNSKRQNRPLPPTSRYFDTPPPALSSHAEG